MEWKAMLAAGIDPGIRVPRTGRLNLHWLWAGALVVAGAVAVFR